MATVVELVHGFFSKGSARSVSTEPEFILCGTKGDLHSAFIVQILENFSLSKTKRVFFGREGVLSAVSCSTSLAGKACQPGISKQVAFSTNSLLVVFYRQECTTEVLMIEPRMSDTSISLINDYIPVG